MTRTAGCPLDGAPWARGGTGSGVVDSGSALYPTAVCVFFLSSTCVSLKTAFKWKWGSAEGRKWGGGRRAQAGRG